MCLEVKGLQHQSPKTSCCNGFRFRHLYWSQEGQFICSLQVHEYNAKHKNPKLTSGTGGLTLIGCFALAVMRLNNCCKSLKRLIFCGKCGEMSPEKRATHPRIWMCHERGTPTKSLIGQWNALALTFVYHVGCYGSMKMDFLLPRRVDTQRIVFTVSFSRRF